MCRHRVNTVVYLFACLLLFTACQPTPEQDVVVNKRDVKLETIVASSPVPFQNERQQPSAADSSKNVEEPAITGGRLQDLKGQSWQGDFTFNELFIHIDTAFEAEGDTCPVYEISSRTFDADFVNAFLKKAGGAMVEMRDEGMTLEEVEAALESAMRGQLQEIDGVITYEPYDGQEEDIAYWGNLYNQMREKGDSFLWETATPIETLPSRKIYRTESKKAYYFSASENYLTFRPGEERFLVAQPESMVLEGNAVSGEPVGTTVTVKGISQEDAISIGEKTMEQVGNPNLKLVSCEKARMVDGTWGTITCTGYMLFYSVGWDHYLPADYMNIHGYTTNKEPQEEYSVPWQFEYSYIFVDGEGEVREIYWQYPLREESLLNENVSILTLEETKSRIVNQLRFLFATNGEGQVEVKRIFLSGLPIKRPGISNGLLIPTWVVEYTYKDDLMDHAQPYLLAMNAIDGSIIDLTKGY